MVVEWLSIIILQSKVFRNRHRKNESDDLTVFRNVPDSCLSDFSDRMVGIFFAIDLDRTGFDFAHSGQSIDQFALTVAVNARNPNDFASVNRKIEILDCLKSMFFNIQPFNFENRF